MVDGIAASPLTAGLESSGVSYAAPRRPLAISHRGAHDGLPENSIPAILRALEVGAQGIELDVHATADNMLVVHHDPDLTDGRTIAALTAGQLAAIELAPGIPIPRLDAVLDAVGKRAMVFIEAKAKHIEMPLLRAVRNAPAECAIHSFDAATVSNLKKLMPCVRVGILSSGAGEAAVDRCAELGAEDIWHLAGDIDQNLVIRARSAGKQVIAWTSNSEQQWRELARMGVDGICSDRIAALAASDW